MLSRLRSVVDAALHRKQFEETMADELRFHMEAFTADLVRSGASPEEAARRARLEFGGVDRVKEECRQARGLQWLDEARQDPSTPSGSSVASLDSRRLRSSRWRSASAPTRRSSAS